MAYIGQGPGSSGITDRTLDTVTSDGSTTSLVLIGTADAAEDVAVYFDGVMQRPGTDFTLANNTLTFTSPVPNGVFVCAYTGGAEHIGSPLAGSVTSDMIVDNAVIDAKVATGVDASKIDGALPQLDGSALTGIGGGVTKTSSDPTITDNPSSAGGLHLNTTTGEMFVCTDNTAGANVWVNVGSGSGDVGKAFGGLGGGTVNGWMMGSAQSTDVIQNYSYSTDAPSNNIASLSSSSTQGTGNSSATHGYKTGGYDGSPTTLIQKFAFVNTAATAATAGNLQTGATGGACSIGNKTHAYTAGGHGASSTIRDIQKFSYDSEGTANKVSDLTNTNGNYHQAGSASVTHGYSAGGEYPGAFVSLIDRFSFANEASISNIGDLTVVTGYTTGESSDTHGYASGGMLTSPFSNATDNIQKYSFASDSVSSADIGSITQSRIKGSSSSSQTRGYHAGGHTGSGLTDRIDRFDFANESQTANVGNLLAAVSGGAGAQH